MEEENKSLIYQIYQKYKKTKEAVGHMNQPIMEEQQPMQVQPEIQVEAFEEEAKEPEIPAEFVYIKSMYELYTYICQERDDLYKAETIADFEYRLLQMIAEHPVCNKHLNAIHHFLEETNLASSILMHRFIRAKEVALAKAEEPIITSEVGSLEDPQETPKETPKENEKDSYSPDAEVHIRSLDNGMFALLLVTPPEKGGKDITTEDLLVFLTQHKIVYGIQEELLQKIDSENLYMQIFIVAQGTWPISGIDGKIVDKTGCRSPRVMKQDQRGKVDFKSLDMYEPVAKDQVICELIPLVDGIFGSDIYGKKLPFVPGKLVNLQNGKNTIISDNRLLLMAAVDGYVSYRRGLYNVEPILVVEENVDYSVGNIDFSGNVIINGDVRFGFTVKAQGSITVKGMVEGAELIADGDIIINKGMNGNHSGTINAKGEVRVSYLENCTVYSEGPVYADSIIACDIYCEDSVHLEGNRGIIIGGTVTALKSIEARMIGSKSRRETTITLGETPRMVAKKNGIKADLEETVKVLEKLKLNVNYLDKLRGSLPPDKLSILTQLSEQRTMYEQRKVELEQTLLVLMQEGTDFSQCYIKSNMIFPITKIIIGNDYTVISSTISKCNIHYYGDEIQIGTL